MVENDNFPMRDKSDHLVTGRWSRNQKAACLSSQGDILAVCAAELSWIPRKVMHVVGRTSFSGFRGTPSCWHSDWKNGVIYLLAIIISFVTFM